MTVITKMDLIGPALLVSALWATAALMQKHVLSHVKSVPAIIIIIGLIMGAISAVFALAHATVFKAELFDKSIPAHVWGILVLSIFIGFFIAYYIYFSLIKNNPAYIVVALTFTAPLFVLLFSIAVLNHNITLHGAAGCLFIVLGTILVAN